MRYEVLRYDEKTTRYKVLSIEGAYIKIREGIKGDKTSVKEFVLKLSPEEMATLSLVLKQNALDELELREQQKQQKKQQENTPSVSPSNFIKIKINQDISEFIGSDGKVYGPYKKGEIIEINKTDALILVNKGEAVFVDDKIRTLEQIV